MPGYRINFVPNREGIRRLIDGPNGPVDTRIRETAEDVAALARRIAPVRTGRLRDSIKVQRYRRGWSVISDAKVTRKGDTYHYSLYIHEGTRPHVIAARHVSTLRFIVRPAATAPINWSRSAAGELPPGSVRYASFVNHPGTRPIPFLRAALGYVTRGNPAL